MNDQAVEVVHVEHGFEIRQRGVYAGFAVLRSSADEMATALREEVEAQTPGSPPADPGYTVELGGQVFTQAQWEAVQVYIEARAQMDSEDAATWTPGRGVSSACISIRVDDALWQAAKAAAERRGETVTDS